MIRFDRIDVKEAPKRPSLLLLPGAWAASAAELMRHRTRIRRKGIKGLKPPYMVLSNHCSQFDFQVALASTFPHRANFVISIDAFVGNEERVRKLGGICKRKFTSDPMLVKQLKQVVDRGDIVFMYPEAKLSLCGTASILPDTMGQLAKVLGVPVVIEICRGHHISDPCWGKTRGYQPTEAEMDLLYTSEDIARMSAEEINEGIGKAFVYDDFRWQKKKRIRVTGERRAEGLHKVLYQCPRCGAQYRMVSKGNRLGCRACKSQWAMDEYGELHGRGHSEGFAHIPDWFEWERENVRREIEAGTYSSGEVPVLIDSLPGTDGFIRIGLGTLVHDMEGIRVEVVDPTKEVKERPTETREMVRSAASAYTCHVIFSDRGDCIDLNTSEDTWYIYPQCGDVSVTKIMLATEEMYKHLHEASAHGAEGRERR